MVADLRFFIAPSAFVSSPIASAPLRGSNTLGSADSQRETSLRQKRLSTVLCLALPFSSPKVMEGLKIPTLRGRGKEKTHHKGVFSFSLVAEMGFEPHDLRVMSPTSYQTAPLRDIVVPEAGVEPVREINLTGF